jgi:hypothetical protein
MSEQRFAQQVKTTRVTFEELVEHPLFARGLREIYFGIAPDWLIPDTHIWEYERGRAIGVWLKLHGYSMPDNIIRGEANPQLVKVVRRAWRAGVMI